MPIRVIRTIAFLTLAVLAPGCSCSNSSCSDCKCVVGQVKDPGYFCDLIKKLQTSKDAVKDKIMHLNRKTSDLSAANTGNENAIRQATKNISKLEVAVNNLGDMSEDVFRQVQELKDDTSKNFITTADKRERLTKDMEEARREARRQRDDLDQIKKNLERLSEEAQGKWRDQENKTWNLEREIAAKSEEDRRRTLKVRKEFLKRVEEAERQTMESKSEVLERLRESEGKLRETDRFLSEQIRKVIDAVDELSRKVEKATVSLTAQQTTTEKLQSKIRKMKNTVSSLNTSQAELKEEIRTNLSVSVGRLKTDFEDQLVELKHLRGNFTTKIKQIEQSQLSLEQELSKCAPLSNLSDLDLAVKKQVRASSIEHQSLRSEMSGHVTELRKQCAARDDVARVNRTIALLSTDLQVAQRQLQEIGKKEVLKANCKDILPISTCKQSVQYHLCRDEYTAKNCCASCAKAP